jgi:hypothetical protein
VKCGNFFGPVGVQGRPCGETMPDSPGESPAAGNEKLVVLIEPEALSGLADARLLSATLLNSPASVRVLLCLAEAADHALVAAVIQTGVETQILLGPDVDESVPTAFTLRAPPGTTATDQKEFALALTDVVLVAAASTQGKLVRLASELGKPLIVAGEPLPAIRPLVSATHRLDPGVPGWHAWGRGIFGRLEQAVMEALAYNWFGGKAGVAESRKRLGKCFTTGWHPRPYFAPDAWRDFTPDPSIDEKSKISVCFDELDRSALHGSYIHRDFAWLEHLGAAFAVVAAVSGHLLQSRVLFGIPLGQAFGFVELATLIVVGMLVFIARYAHLQDRWTACRLGAEQLRITRMSLPLLVLPSALATSDKPQPASGDKSKERDFGFAAMAQVKRAVRDQGLPRPIAGFSPAQAAAWIHLIVRDQIEYHRRNCQKLEHAERRLHSLTKWIFVSAVIAVLVHLVLLYLKMQQEWLLLFTAATPAVAAALHGTGTRLGIVHRAALSSEMDRQLTNIDGELVALMRPAPDETAAWREVRHLTFEAAKAMGQENTSWHSLVRRYRDDLP